MRAFVAVEASPPSERSGSTAPEHLTLRFLGEITEDAVARIRAQLEPVGGRIAPFAMRLEGVGAFPTEANPRVVWVGVSAGREELIELAHQVREALAAEGRHDTDPFAPHLTLFRVRSSSDRRAALELLEGRRPPPPPRTVAVHEFVLKESVLGPYGARHRTVAAFPLRGPSRGA
jgi:RNA 2',3'-cyclic 3'-phosphodiesterase